MDGVDVPFPVRLKLKTGTDYCKKRLCLLSVIVHRNRACSKNQRAHEMAGK